MSTRHGRIKTREEFGEYMLRTLGAPVIQINVDESHVDDSIDDALQKFWDYHRDGSSQSHFIVKVTDEDVKRGYIKTPPNIDDIVEIISGGTLENIGSWTTPQWQMTQSMLAPKSALVSIRLTDYVAMQQRLADISSTLSAPRPFVFKKYQRRIYPQFNMVVGEILAFSGYENIDPDEEDGVEAWNDPWLKAYATNKLKLRWGEILKKVQGVQFVGGIELNGSDIYNEAKDEIERLEEELRTGHQEPINFMMG